MEPPIASARRLACPRNFWCARGIARPSPAATVVGRTLPTLSPLSAGGFHTCGLDSSGHAWCWGLDVYGEVGDGLDDQDKLAPIAVVGGLTFTSLTAGWIHTCGRDTNGLTWCWGKDGAFNQRTPVNVVGAFSFLAAGAEFTCALDPAGHAWCWGYDTYGQVGDGPADQSFKNTPVAVAADLSFTSVAAGSNHACGLDATGQALCWGWDLSGQVGDGPPDQENKYAPIEVAGDLSFTSLVAGSMHTCGLDGTGKAWCWGNDTYGQVGDGPADQGNKYAPIRVAGDLSFTSLAAGSMHTCGLDRTGNAWCWGDDASGQVGDGPADQAQKPSPVAVAGGVVFSSLTAGGSHTCGVDATDQAWCWGRDEDGQIGDGPADQGNENAPVAVAGGISFTIP
jgi:alpha-tubulin suppressor-like RCC1 family protein